MASTLSAENWKSLGFAQLQQTLDEQSSKINESQEEGVASRRALSAQTKAFRKLDDEEKLHEVRGLLKNYQAEIDVLTSRTKYAEQCFMNVYKSLALLPDPAPLLDAQRAEIEGLRARETDTRPSDEDSRLARELERQTLRVSQLERQLSAAQAAPPAAAAAEAPAASDAQDRLDTLEKDLSARRLQIRDLQHSVKEQSALTERYQTEHQQTLSQLAAQSDYDELKRELVALRQAPPDGEPGLDVSTRRELKSLEAQNRQLSEERNGLKRDLDQVRRLASKLEDDLSAMQNTDSFSTVSGWTAVPRSSTGSVAPGSAAGTSSGSSAVSGIVMQQRDRYKRRMQELEEKLHRTEIDQANTKRELDSVKRESYKLYDRVRQLSGSVPGTGATASVVPPLYEPTVEQKLKELDLDRRCVEQPAYQVKLLEVSARLLVDTKFRTGAAAYVAAVHLLALLGLVF